MSGKGRTCSPETRAKISAAKRGKKRTPETIAKMSAAMKGRKLSPEHRAKLSEVLKSRMRTPEHQAKLNAGNRGRVFSPETRKKMSLAQMGNMNHLTHGMCGTPTYNSWGGMIKRTTNPKFKRWKDYGGRGITVCAPWRLSFENFFTDVGPCPPGMSIDRIDNDGNYEPGNVRWATPKEQANNRSREKALPPDAFAPEKVQC